MMQPGGVDVVTARRELLGLGQINFVSEANVGRTREHRDPFILWMRVRHERSLRGQLHAHCEQPWVAGIALQHLYLRARRHRAWSIHPFKIGRRELDGVFGNICLSRTGLLLFGAHRRAQQHEREYCNR